MTGFSASRYATNLQEAADQFITDKMESELTVDELTLIAKDEANDLQGHAQSVLRDCYGIEVDE